ncbi:FAD-dependent monooxygenase [Glycomyces xiaoerkulensis]|uniref:FAD-dependent monooxygenase n=1 Tax=Glycomyces xiaoerkulensis TaxID=2038139 RepID=UPI000C2581EB|nr:FAD-dependent monooxygenase [Glycomyces xiaoerkulensis]
MKAVICGAGIAGLALAGRLGTHGWDVTVVEQAHGPRAQGYMIDFFGPGYEAMTAMGLRDRLREAANPTSRFHYVDERGRTRVSVEFDSFAKALDGELASIMRPDLERVLRDWAAERAEIRYGTTIERIDADRVVLSDGTTAEADLVVGADGVHSRIRGLVFGPESDYLRFLGMHTAAYVFEDAEVYEQVRGRFVLTESINRQMGFYGLPDGKAAVFAVHRVDRPDLPADPRAELRRAHAGLGDLTERALAKCPPNDEIYYDQVAQIAMPRWTDGRVALLGDAAHAVSLVAGQGASLGVAGAYVLAERLHACGSVPEALADWEDRWRPVAERTRQAARDRAIEWFLPATKARLRLRRWGFRAMRLPGLDRLLLGPLIPKSHRSVTELGA